MMPRPEDYQGMDPITHVLMRPSMYVGDMKPELVNTWILDINTWKMRGMSKHMCLPLRHIFYEVLDNAADNADRSWRAGVDPIRIEVLANRTTISVRNFGLPIPVAQHPQTQQWVPQMIFGELRTGSNFDDSKSRVTIGQNGFGIKLVSILSGEEFTVDITDATRGLRYVQTWCNNMRIMKPPVITKLTTPTTISEVTVLYKADFKYFSQFGVREYDDEWLGMFARQVADISLACKIPCTFNNHTIDNRDIKTYAALMFPPEIISKSIHHVEPTPPGSYVSPLEAIFLDTPYAAQNLAIVNGRLTPAGGVHVDAAIHALTKPIIEKLKKSDSADAPRLDIRDVRPHISLVMCCRVEKPTLRGQVKDYLLSPTPTINLPESVIKIVNTWELVGRLIATLEDKNWKKVAKKDGQRKNLLADKISDANFAGKAGKVPFCIAIVVEGDSAKTNVLNCIDNRDYNGIFPFRGKMPNVSNLSMERLVKNNEFTAFRQFMGLREGTRTKEEFEKTLRYGTVVMKFDPDDDGIHITSLFMNWMRLRHPLMLTTGRIILERIPIITLQVSGSTLGFFSKSDHNKWITSIGGPSVASRFKPKYHKGLGTSSPADVEYQIKNRRLVSMICDQDANDEFERWFNENAADLRKAHISEWKEKYELEALPSIPITIYLKEEFVKYGKLNLLRAIPNIMDGLKTSQRKILWTLIKSFGTQSKKFAATGECKSIVVERLAARVAEFTCYHHGATSLEGAIFVMGAAYVGSNNMPYLVQDGQFGSRMMGGQDTPAARYPKTKPQRWLGHAYLEEDNELLTMLLDDNGEDLIEPAFLLPPVPMQLINGYNGIASGWSTYGPNFNPLDVIAWFESRNTRELNEMKETKEAKEQKEKKLPMGKPDALPFMPWWRGFMGKVEVRKINPGKGKKAEKAIIPARYMLPESIFTQQEMPYLLRIITSGNMQTYSGGVCIITELPIGRWTTPYENYLTSLYEQKKIGKPVNKSKPAFVHIELKDVKLTNEKELKMKKSYPLTKMVMLMPDNSVRHFKTIDEILETFYNLRLSYYIKRRALIIKRIEDHIMALKDKLRFHHLVKTGQIVVVDRSVEALKSDLKEHKLPEKIAEGKLRSIMRDNSEQLKVKIAEAETQLKVTTETTANHLWLKDLASFKEVVMKSFPVKK